MLLLFLVIHLVLCLVLYLLIWLGALKCGKMAFMLVLLVPVWGVVCLVIQEIRARGKQQIREEVGIEKLKVNDEVHKSILMEEDPAEERVVPLEEALLINDPSLRRELMMEVMYSNPDDYVEQLQEARMNDDTEVVHYAVTALAELQKDYDLKFQEIQRRMEEEPDDDELLEKYLELLDQYLGSGLLEGNARELQLRNYSNLLSEKLKKDGDSLRLYEKKIQADLLVGEYNQAYEDIERVLNLWPKHELGYLFLIQYYASVKNRAGISQTLELLERRQIHLSAEGRGTVRFWKDGSVKADEA
ncbi:MAG TPA: hypothetical protein IAB61_07685 [Candidatus Merdisoma merdipullorum]|nr:hypothetical protein [Candidatus Merdisoma merdipullorum]